MRGQVITFFVGQCGCQLANACWELYCLEHCISPDGKQFENDTPEDISFQSFFLEISKGHFVPRSLLIDLEPSVIDEIKIGNYRHLFNPNNLIFGYEDAANNFARGFYSCAKVIVEAVVNSTRKLVESSDNVEAFMAVHSFGGGTGSGFTSMLLEYLSVEYTKISKIEYGALPSPTLSVAVVEPYNAILALHTPMENADLAAVFENESLYKICANHLNVDSPLFTNLNRMSAQVISGMTCSMRFEGPINARIMDYQTNLVPYPRIHFPLVNFSPFISHVRKANNSITTKELTMEAFNQDYQMSSINPLNGYYMSSCMLFRGDVTCRDASNALACHKRSNGIHWVNWCPTGYKVGINYQPMIAIPASGMAYSSRSLTVLCNTTAVKQIIHRLNHRFMLMYTHKSFVHWYVSEGMEEEEFKEAYEDVLILEKDFGVLDDTATACQSESQTTTTKKSSDMRHTITSSVTRITQSAQSKGSTTRASRNTVSAESTGRSDIIIKVSPYTSKGSSNGSSNLPYQNSKSEENLLQLKFVPVRKTESRHMMNNSYFENHNNEVDKKYLNSILNSLSTSPYRTRSKSIKPKSHLHQTPENSFGSSIDVNWYTTNNRQKTHSTSKIKVSNDRVGSPLQNSVDKRIPSTGKFRENNNKSKSPSSQSTAKNSLENSQRAVSTLNVISVDINI